MGCVSLRCKAEGEVAAGRREAWRRRPRDESFLGYEPLKSRNQRIDELVLNNDSVLGACSKRKSAHPWWTSRDEWELENRRFVCGDGGRRGWV
jgi:hypothetical protein